MDSPKRNANAAIGTQVVITPVAGWPNSSSEPNPCCQTSTVTPYAAAMETTLSASALTGSQRDLSARASSRNVTMTTPRIAQMKLPDRAHEVGVLRGRPPDGTHA